MQTKLVKGLFEGDRAKSVMAHADSNVGYVILERGKRGGTPYCLAAFHKPIDGPLPHHLQEIFGSEADRIEKIFNKRLGTER